MPQRDPWTSRALIGAGVVIASVVVALPAFFGAPKEIESPPRAVRPVVVRERWFGMPVTPGAPGAERPCLELPCLGGRLLPVAELSVVRLSDGCVRLVGALAERAPPGGPWLLEAEVSDPLIPGTRRDRAEADAREELTATFGRGLAEMATLEGRRSFGRFEGTLRGHGERAGAVLEVEEASAFQVGLGANGRNLDHGASRGLEVRLLQQPTKGPTLPAASVGARVNLDLLALPTSE